MPAFLCRKDQFSSKGMFQRATIVANAEIKRGLNTVILSEFDGFMTGKSMGEIFMITLLEKKNSFTASMKP